MYACTLHESFINSIIGMDDIDTVFCYEIIVKQKYCDWLWILFGPDHMDQTGLKV